MNLNARRWLLLLVLLAALGAPSLHAAAPEEFDDPAEQARYDRMLAEMRCLVCQNESLAESPASLAQDLRREVAERIRAGHSDAAIREFLVSRYGDYVLYRPPLRGTTVVLWFGPLVILMLAATGALVYVRRRRPVRHDLAADEQERLARLLQERNR